ncbi:MAG: ribose-5-phosphate isomerase RpiA [Methanomassiliicoccales archaeon]|nr:ribose-5-phosphate isomerase RpiA [Methanomassiliicoccales archaeon]
MSERKRLAAERAVEFVQDGMKVGLGTGSTAAFAIDAIGRLVKDGYDLLAVPTSVISERQARELGIPLATLEEAGTLDITIDGADEVDGNLDLIKGMGGALLREKIVAYSTRQEIIIVDDSKLVHELGTKFPLPVEVVQFSHGRTRMFMEELGCKAELRGGAAPFVTDNGNFIYHLHFEHGIRDPYELQRKLDDIPGVVEMGLFLKMAKKVIVASEQGIRVMERV